jgi:cytosine/uracil/thiamine/allantoin permease
MFLALFCWVCLCWVFIATAIYMQNVLFMLGAIPAGIIVIDKWLVRAPLLRHD